MSALPVAFVDHVGATAGGAEETLATFLAHAPPHIVPSAILFEPGAFAERLRSLGVAVDIVAMPATLGTATRERLRLRAAADVPAIAREVARALRRRGARLVYTNSMKAHIIGSLAARLVGIPCVMHFHDIVDGRARSAIRLAARWGSRRRVACSHAVARAIGLPATDVIYGPIELERYRVLPDRAAARAELGLPPDAKIVALVGRINRWKGHDRLVRAAARVVRDTDAHFAIVGAPVFRDADYVPELHALIERLALRERFTFVPWLADVRTIYAAADVNVNCSTREPFGRAVVEAAACGVPTVCFDDSGAGETIVDAVSGRLVPAGDEAAFAAALDAMLRDDVSRARMAAAARAGSVRFDAPRIAGEMLAVINGAA